MAGCKKATRKIIKRLIGGIPPLLATFIRNTTVLAEQTNWSNAEKREHTVDFSIARAKQLGIAVKETAIRAFVEVSVEGGHALADELDDFNDADMEAIGVDGILELAVAI